MLGAWSRRAVGRVALKTVNRVRARAAGKSSVRRNNLCIQYTHTPHHQWTDPPPASPAALLRLSSTLQPYRTAQQHPPARGIFGVANPGGGGVPAKKEEGETAVAKPIDFDVSARVEGQETQIVVVRTLE